MKRVRRFRVSPTAVVFFRTLRHRLRTLSAHSTLREDNQPIKRAGFGWLVPEQ